MINLFSTPVYSTTLNLNNKSLELSCYSIQKVDQGVTKSNEGGYQSNNIISSKEFLPLFTDIVVHCQNFKDSLGFKKDVSIANAWININSKGALNLEHTHSHCLFSGVYYIKTPNNCGDIYFSNPNPVSFVWNLDDIKDSSRSLIANEKWFVKSNAGVLLLFPSWAKHGVTSNMSNEDRISISFNCI